MNDQESVSFLSLNIVIIGIVALAIFGYLVMIIRKRWRSNFLHGEDKNKRGKT